MWLMEHQMNQAASALLGAPIEGLPLTRTADIRHANALRLDWHTVLPAAQCSYVLGNPPFVGKHYQNAEQKADMAHVWEGVKGAGVLDFVTCWYRRAAQYLSTAVPGRVGVPPAGSGVSPERSSGTREVRPGGTPRPAGGTPTLPGTPSVAFVSTNSISQGEQVGILSGDLFQRYGIKIHFAHRTFPWASESRGKAHVHVVIIGFGVGSGANK